MSQLPNPKSWNLFLLIMLMHVVHANPFSSVDSANTLSAHPTFFSTPLLLNLFSGEISTSNCPAGFEMDPGGNCVDIDECAAGGACGPNEICTNLNGGFQCDCAPGFIRNNDGDCIQDCSLLLCGPNQQCVVDNNGLASCECAPGFTRSDPTMPCIDIDECALGGACGPNEICTNLNGSFQCDCAPGFIRIGNGECIADPCAIIACPSGKVCVVDNIGNPSCECQDGFFEDTNGDCVPVIPCSVILCSVGLVCVEDANGNGMCINPVPVTLSNFTSGPTSDGKVLLNWETTTEQSNAGFEIQHSTDLKSWNNLNFIPGAGDSQKAISYQFEHQKPSPGLNYYRLHQIDLDGTGSFSKITFAELDFTTELSVYPNPSQQNLYIELPANAIEVPLTISLIGLDGRVVSNIQLNAKASLVKVEFPKRTPPGLYLLRLSTNRATYTKQVIKQ
ncbi:MAG: T9SS type A sorting domain-containing protein [Bacteroidota bacterium]